MRSQRSIVRKAAKAKARRKDYAYRRRVNANVPTIVSERKEEKYAPVMNERRPVYQPDGRPKLEHVGYRTVIVKIPDYRHKDPADPTQPLTDANNRPIPMIAYPKPRKYQHA